jgi:hypothetical protein
MITIVFAGFLLLSMTVAMIDWRRGWLMAILCGILQDPARKLTPGAPVAMTLSVILVYMVILFAASGQMQKHAMEFTRRFNSVYGALIIVMLFLVLAAIRGLFTFGIEGWKAPALSLFIYCAPIPAVLLGFTWLQREENIYSLFKFYAAATSIAMLGTPLEYLDLKWRALGTVALSEYNIRHLPGIQIRMLSGFYRAPDVMGWHAAMLAIIGLIMTLRMEKLQRAWGWMGVTGWGVFNCFLSGRRKAVYMVAVFVLVFLWRYFRRLTATHIITFVLALGVIGWVVHKISADEGSNVYARGAVTTRGEVFQRLEGGLLDTIDQYGILGAGLGTATQGVYHVAPGNVALGWQEGGLGKLAMELGVPGLIAVILLAATMFRMMLAISRHPDMEGSTQLIRCALVGIVAANVVEFLVSAQAYSDAVLALMTAFFIGCVFATAVLDERLAADAATSTERPRPLTAPATA